MRIIYLLLPIIIMSVFTLACVEEDNLQTIEETTDISIGPKKFVLELDEYTQARNSITGFTPDENYYYFYNDFNQSLYFYSLDQEINTPKKIVKVPLDESINFKSVSDLYIHSMDSIFIFSDHGYYGLLPDVFLINAESEVLDMFDLLNMEDKDSQKLNKKYAYSSNTVFYHQGKLIIPVQINAHTDESKYKPLFIYDIVERKGEYYGEYPPSFEISKYSDDTYNLHASFIPELGKVYLSFPYEANLYTLDLSDYSWNAFSFETDLVSQPAVYEGGNDMDKMYYFFTNSWYINLYYDKASNSILRQAHIGQRFGKNDPPPYGGSDAPKYPSLNGDKVYDIVFAIDPETGEYSVIRDMNFLEVRFFHPQFGLYQISEINEELGLDAEDYVVFTPMMEN